MSTPTLYGFSPSGSCHRVRLLLEQLGRPYRWVETDSSRGATRTPEFLALNPNGKVPLLALEDGRTPADSARRADLPRLRERGHQALAVMERHLLSSPWFTGAGTGAQYGIADTDVAGEGGFDLSPYSALRDWLARVRATPGFVPMALPSAEAAALLALPG